MRRVSLFQCFCNNLDPVHRIQTKFGMDILLDPRNKPAEEFFIFLKIQDGRRRSKVQNRPKNHIFCNNLDPVHWIQTKFGMDILLDPRNKPAKEFFIFLKIQDGRRRSQICDAFHFFNVFAIIWIRFIGSRQNLAWTYYLTLGTNLRKNFSFFSKSKMAAGGQKSKIGQILPHKSHFGSSFGSGSSDLDQI